MRCTLLALSPLSAACRRLDHVGPRRTAPSTTATRAVRSRPPPSPQEVSQREVAALRVFEGRHAGRRLMLDADACLRAAARAAGPARPDFFDRAEPTLLGLEAAAAADARSQEALAATAAASHAATAAAAEVGAPAAEAAAAAEADDEEAVWRASQARHREEMRRPPPRLPCPPGALCGALGLEPAPRSRRGRLCG